MDPYSAVFNEHIDPSYMDPDLPVSNFNMQYDVPSINYYQFKSRAPATTTIPSTCTNTSAPQPSTSANLSFQPHSSATPGPSFQHVPQNQPIISLTPAADISDLDFLDDSFDIQIMDVNDAEQAVVERILHASESLNTNATEMFVVENSNTGSFNKRFQSMNENQRVKFVEQTENKNTKRKMDGNVKVFVEFLANVKLEFRQIQVIPPYELDRYLQEFYLGIRKETKNDATDIEKEYQPGTLHSYMTMINRYLKKQNYGYDITTANEFKISRECLTAKKKQLKEMGLGNKPNAAESIEEADEDELFRSGGLGIDDADSLLRTIWYLNTMKFGLRGVDEHKKMCWGTSNCVPMLPGTSV